MRMRPRPIIISPEACQRAAAAIIASARPRPKRSATYSVSIPSIRRRDVMTYSSYISLSDSSSLW